MGMAVVRSNTRASRCDAERASTGILLMGSYFQAARTAGSILACYRCSQLVLVQSPSSASVIFFTVSGATLVSNPAFRRGEAIFAAPLNSTCAW